MSYNKRVIKKHLVLSLNKFRAKKKSDKNHNQISKSKCNHFFKISTELYKYLKFYIIS
jgi:hypothetical protein